MELVQFLELEFEYAELLWLLLLALILGLWSAVQRIQPLLAVLLRTLLLATLIIALAGPFFTERRREEQLSVLVDVSGSIPDQALDLAAERIAAFSAEERSIDLFSFAADTADAVRFEGVLDAAEVREAIRKAQNTLSRDATAMTEALQQVSLQGSGPVLLISDGYSTSATYVEEAQQLGQLGRGVFPLLLPEPLFLQEQLEIATLFAPVTAKAGERITIYGSVRNTRARSEAAILEFWLDEKKIAEKQLQVEGGSEQRVEVETPELEGGLKRIRTVLKNADGTSLTRHRWISVKEKSRLLLIHGSEEDSSQLEELLRLRGYAAQHVTAHGREDIPLDFSKFSAIIINNTAKHQLPAEFLPNLELFAKAGGGVLLIGGDRSFGLGNYIDTPLETISPLKFVPPQTKKKRLRVAVALVLDKSGSMSEQNKLLGAKRAVAMSIESLKDEDYVTVVAFDDSPFVLIDLATVADAKPEVDRRLRNLTAAGQTNLLPALGHARQSLKRAKAGRKHMIVMSDGQVSLSTDSFVQEINSLKREGITVSTIGLGFDADPFLSYLANTGGGAYHAVMDPEQLPKIFVEDIRVATGEETMAEQDRFPVGLGPGGLQSTSLKRYPPLRGFVETLPKKGSKLELITKRGSEVFPILASWKYGKGRVAAFSSDANGRWSRPWLRWPQFLRFWSQIFDWIRSGDTGQAGDVDFDLRYAVSQGALQLELLVYDEKLRSGPPPSISARLIAPNKEQLQPSFSVAAAGRFEASIPEASPGDYQLFIKYGSVDLPQIGITLHDDSFGEQVGKGLNYASLEAIATQSGAALNPSASELRLEANETVSTTKVYLPLVIAAFILVLLEAVLRERLRRS